MDLSKVSACLISKDPVYPPEILANVSSFPFGEILILTHSDSPYRKHELFSKARNDWLYYQDDDAICPIQALAYETDPEAQIITLAMKQGHFDAYRNTRMTMGMGWGAFFPKSVLDCLRLYLNVYGEDFLFKRDTEKILTSLCYPQKRLVLPIQDLPSASAQNRLWRDPNHYTYGALCEERCSALIRKEHSK